MLPRSSNASAACSSIRRGSRRPWPRRGPSPASPTCAHIAAAGDVAQLALLCAHPELSGKAAVAGTITAESAREQDAAGLLHCSHAEFAALRRMNAQYRERFGFPFIVAVRGLDRVGILARLEARLGNDRDSEFAEALRQVERIAALRLAAMIEA